MFCYLAIWGLFTFCMFIATLKLKFMLQVIFLSLAILFWLIALTEVTAMPKIIAGIEGVFCGASAMYLAIAEVINEVYGRTVLPV